jgi:tRNA threonylcarbamoyladenosine biosynthesis protein TsaE
MSTIDLPDETATATLAACLAERARAGDVIALKGDLGTGKTTFARAFIAALGGGEEVPSPTFTLVQTYAPGAVTIWHFDLYRLEAPEEAWELGIEEAFATGIALVEWPERLGPLIPANRLEIALAFGARPEARQATLSAGPDWAARLADIVTHV